jgi:hypothetical protein
MEKMRICDCCREEKPLSEFIKYTRSWSYSVKCKDCTRPPKEVVIFKDGKLNTRQVKGFNWLLGYSIKHN